MKGAGYLHNRHDGPSDAIVAWVRSGQWTEGGMAEAGWFLVGHTSAGAPIFSRTSSNKVSFA